MKFPNKVLRDAYIKALNHTFTHSPSNFKFFDENDCCDYNYHAMIWLLYNDILQELPYNPKDGLVVKYRINKR